MIYVADNIFINLVRFIYKNIDKPFTLEDLAKEGNVSLSTLKRIFSEAVNCTPGEFIRRLRMELAFRTLQSREDSILEIALSSGFEDQAAFSRAFKKMFGYSPKNARNKINIISEFESVDLGEPDMIMLNDLPIQSITQQGIYFESAKKAWDMLREKLNDKELSDDFSGFFVGIGHDNPHEEGIDEDKVRYSAGIALLNRNLGVEHKVISSGMYARFHYKGKPMNLGLAYHYIYGKWSQESGIKINKHIPAFVAFDYFPQAMEEAKLLIHVPCIT